MTTKTMPVTHEERCCELVELTIECPEFTKEFAAFQKGREDELPKIEGCCPLCDGNQVIPDPRFVSLRGEHEIGKTASYVVERCLNCGCTDFDAMAGTYCLRTDGDALDDAIVATGYQPMFTWSEDWPPNGNRMWFCALQNKTRQADINGSGATPREAKSAALWQAVFGG